MPHDVTMPQLGMAQDAGKIVAWLKKPGDPVAAGEALFEVETDKATMEVEAQAAGFLTEVRAAEGEDVPVGRVIARISETPEAAAPAPSAPVSAAASGSSGPLPEGRAVTMPQLGMAQDTGIVVTWHVAPGDRVAEGDVLFEVETDKATMEVPASASGYVAALLAGEGEEVPVGETVAILSDRMPEAPVRQTRAAAGGGTPPAAQPPAAAPSSPAPAAEPLATAPATPRPAPSVVPASLPHGRILASPKARKLALERGIDLSRLVAAGVPQPLHARDVEAFVAPAAAPASCRLSADTLRDGFTPFAAWAAETVGITDAAALLAGFAAASLRRAMPATAPLAIAVTGRGQDRVYPDPDESLGRTEPAAGPTAPTLILRDLRGSRITAIDTGPDSVPVITVGGRKDRLTITLVWGEGQLPSDAALALVDGLAARLEDPLHHLLL